MVTQEIEERTKFLQVYYDFKTYLNKLSFECDGSYNIFLLNFHYLWYDKQSDNLFGGYYINKKLKISIRFLKYKNIIKINLI